MQEMEQQLSDVRSRVIEVTEEMHDLKQMKEGESVMLGERINELELQLQEALSIRDRPESELLSRAMTSQAESSKLAAEARPLSEPKVGRMA